MERKNSLIKNSCPAALDRRQKKQLQKLVFLRGDGKRRLLRWLARGTRWLAWGFCQTDEVLKVLVIQLLQLLKAFEKHFRFLFPSKPQHRWESSHCHQHCHFGACFGDLTFQPFVDDKAWLSSDYFQLSRDIGKVVLECWTKARGQNKQVMVWNQREFCPKYLVHWAMGLLIHPFLKNNMKRRRAFVTMTRIEVWGLRRGTRQELKGNAVIVLHWSLFPEVQVCVSIHIDSF